MVKQTIQSSFSLFSHEVCQGAHYVGSDCLLTLGHTDVLAILWKNEVELNTSIEHFEEYLRCDNSEKFIEEMWIIDLTD